MLHSRHFLDITTPDLLFGASGFLNRADGARATESLESDIGPGTIVAFSVRSAWDLLLTTLALPAGSEVIMSAVTIPDMARIVEAHGLIVIPIDLDPETMTPRIDLYTRAFGDRTRLVLLAHLLGGSFDIGPYADIAATQAVPLIEDCAQSFEGPHTWGSDRALVSLFSFGSIKTSTSLGAAVVRVRDRKLFESMQRINETRPIQSCDRFAKKAVKYLAVQGFRSPMVYGAVARLASRSSGGLDGFISRTVKGFAAASAEDFLHQLRQRPCAAQVALLRRRLEGFDGRRLAARTERGEMLIGALASAGLALGRSQPRRSHWLFALSVSNPGGLITRLRQAGFDATQGATTIGPLFAPRDRQEFDPAVIRSAMSRAVFLPAYPEMRSSEFTRLITSIVFSQTGVRLAARPRSPQSLATFPD